jgi:hypothetical protein
MYRFSVTRELEDFTLGDWLDNNANAYKFCFYTAIVINCA